MTLHSTPEPTRVPGVRGDDQGRRNGTTRARHTRPAQPNGSPAGTRPSDPRGEGDDPKALRPFGPWRAADFSAYGMGTL